MGQCISADARPKTYSASMPAAHVPLSGVPLQTVAARESAGKLEGEGHTEEEPDALDLEIGSDFVSCTSHGTHISSRQQSVIEEKCHGTNQLEETDAEKPADSPNLESRHADSRAASCAREALQVFHNSEEGCSSACKVLLRHAWQSGAHALEELSQEVEGMHGQDAATMKRLLSTAGNALKDLERMRDDSGWQVVADSTMKLMYKHESGSPVHCIKARTDMEAPIENVTALLVEFDLIKTWNKYIVESLILKHHSLTGLLCLATCWLPWPFSNADLIVEATGLDLLKEEQRCIYISFQTPESLPEGVQLPPSHATNKHLQAKPGSYFHYQPLPPLAPGKPARVRCCIEIVVDPDIKHVPSALISFVLQVLAPFFYTTVTSLLKRTFKRPTEALPRRMLEQPLLYDIVRQGVAAQAST